MGAIPQFVGTVLASLVLLNRDRIGLEPGAIVTYMFLFTRLATNLSAQAGLVSRIRLLTPDLEALAKSIQEFQTSGVVHQEKPISPEVQRTYDSYFKGPVGWDVKNLEFYYEPGKPLFVGLNLPIQPSTTTVIKGRSGVGKSTLVSLLIGELDPTKGQISLTTADGQAVPLMGVKQSLTRHLGYVGPESFLIEGTVRENLCYGLARNPTDEEIHEAVKTAECQFIYDWELALEHPITEQGQGLSAGQKQRLCLARALLRHPKVLLLDEATANLDSETEERLLETFKKLKTKMTLLIITHRPASLAIADRVVEL
jgi:ABC-type multidrug transport system fused ATPase/permease subunit